MDYSFMAVDLKFVRDFIEANHYSKSVNGCKVTQCYCLLDGLEIVGAMLFGELSTTSWKRYGQTEKDVIELRRLCTKDDCVKNTESWFVAQAIKHLKKKYSYKICISYADPYHGHVGYIYQATNWNFVGTTNKDKLLKTPEGKLYHSRAMRTKYKGDYKPFAKRLRLLDAQGRLEVVEVPGKYIYTYTLDKKQKSNGAPYPKGTSPDQLLGTGF
jgi:hypothetical protein